MASTLNGRTFLTLAELSNMITLQGEFPVGEDEFVTQEELNFLINMSLAELYDLLSDVYQDYFLAQTLLDVDGANEGRSALLPADFQRALKVFYLDGDRRVAIGRFDLEHLSYNFNPGAYPYKYRIMGENVWFDPLPPAGSTSFELWYVPRYQWLEDGADRVHMSVPITWTNYVIADVIARLLAKEESDPSYWIAKKMEERKRIIEASSQRDAGKSWQIIDAYDNQYEWPWIV